MNGFDWAIAFTKILKYVVLGFCGLGLWFWWYISTRTEKELKEMGVNLKGKRS